MLGRTGTQRGERWLFSFFNNPCYEPKKIVWTPTWSTNFPFCQTTVNTSVLPKLLRLCYGSWMNQRSKVLIGWGVRHIQMPSPCQWESQKWSEQLVCPFHEQTLLVFTVTAQLLVLKTGETQAKFKPSWVPVYGKSTSVLRVKPHMGHLWSRLLKMIMPSISFKAQTIPLVLGQNLFL